MQHTSSRQRGFTVVELIIAMTTAAVLMTGLIVVIVNLVSSSSDTIKVSGQISNNNAAISTIERDLQLTRSFLATNSLSDSDSSISPANPNGWIIQGASADNRILILQTYATTAQPQNSSRAIVYYNDNIGGCPVGRTPVYNNIIYFLRNSTLYRRTLVETSPASPYCPGQSIAQIRTCSTTACPQRDVAIATNISRFSVQYYEEPADTSPNGTVYTASTTDAGALLANIKSIRIDIRSSGINETQGGIPALNSYRRLTKGTQHE